MPCNLERCLRSFEVTAVSVLRALSVEAAGSFAMLTLFALL